MENLLSAVNAILITGPTASGKSALAVELAKEHGGVVINADSMQVYDTLRVLTARPSEEDMDGVPHRLYGHVPAAQAYSTGSWLRNVTALLPRIHAEGKMPVFVGGTGLYFKALTGAVVGNARHSRGGKAAAARTASGGGSGGPVCGACEG